MAFVDAYVAEFIRLEVALFHARSRLVAETDPEALHDLRIAVRRIRSLLTPLRPLQEFSGVREAAAVQKRCQIIEGGPGCTRRLARSLPVVFESTG